MPPFQLEGHKLHLHPERVGQYLTTGDCRPILMEISPVGDCNHRCIFCVYDHIGRPNRRLPVRETLLLLEQAAQQGLKAVVFAGEGEPLRHPDCALFVEHAAALGLDVGLFTNGQLFKGELAQRILARATYVRFSFNAGTAGNYAQIHGVGPAVFDQVVGNIRAAAALRTAVGYPVDLGIQSVLVPENYASLAEAAAFAAASGVDYYVVKPFMRRDWLTYQPGSQVGMDIESLRRTVLAHNRPDFFATVRGELLRSAPGKRYDHCLGTSFMTVLNSAGELAACLAYWERPEFVFGNIHKNTFAEIWDGAARKKIKKHLENELDAGNCPGDCRLNQMNEWLWGLSRKTHKHMNFL